MNTNESSNPGNAPDGPEEPPAPVEVTQAHGLVPAPASVLNAVPALPEAMPLVEPALQEPVAEVDPARTGATGKAGPRPLPETLTAARDAAAFVAQLFAEVSAPEQATPIPSVVQVPSSTDETVQGDAENEVPAAIEPAGESATHRWAELRWQGKPGERSVFVIDQTAGRPQDVVRVALRGTGPLRQYQVYEPPGA